MMLKNNRRILRLLAVLLALSMLLTLCAAADNEGDSTSADAGSAAEVTEDAAQEADSTPEDAAAEDTESSENAENTDAEGDSENTITISSVQDLIDLSESCSEDSWSVGKTVVLQSNLNLKDSDFEYIPSFGGTFDGSGYTISGLTIRDSCSPGGLFAELQSTAVVRDLTVTGSVTPSGSGTDIGGLVGVNSGRLVNCSFSGTVQGQSCTGGLVGRNTDSGVITLCHMDGSVTGMSMTGGVAGCSSGTILGCESNAQINNVSVDPTLDVSSLDLSLDLSTIRTDASTTNVPTDTGGIAGYSSGSIMACVSTGTAGYPHVGYNVGGIAGRSCGYVMSCKSQGTVNGRKDLGGIVGQAEPNVQAIVDDVTLSSLQDQVSAMQDTVAQLQTDASGAKDAIQDQVDGLSDSLTDVAGELKNINTSVSISVPDLSSLLSGYLPDITLPDSIGGTISSSVSGNASGSISSSTSGELSDAADAAADAVSDAVSDAADDAATAASQAAETAADTAADSVSASVEHSVETSLSGSADGSISASVDGVSDAVNSVLKSVDLSDVSSAVSSYVNGIQANATTDLSGVRSAIKTMAGEISTMNTALSGESDAIDSDLSQLTGQAGDITDTVNDLIDQEDAGTLLMDVSAVDPENVTLGKIFSCTNSGTVDGDLNVGGIAGSAGLEYALDPEDDTTISLEDPVTTEYDLTSVIYKCTNTGSVTAKRDYAGGIVGLQSLGITLSCESYGPVESTSGDYVGGIAGQNSAVIRSCYAKTTLAGDSYVGGITGYSVDENSSGNSAEVTDCISMVTVSRGDEYVGAISGSENGTFSDNYFVSDTLSGLNRVSRTGVAQPVDYETLLTMDVPNEFRHVTVTFVAQDTVVDTLELDYGDTLKDSDLPEIPEVDGSYGVWELPESDVYTMDTTVNADYEPYVTTISSSETRDNGRPVFYLQGDFNGTSALTADRSEDTVDVSQLSFTTASRLSEYGREVLEQWTVTIPEDGQETHTIRYQTPSGDTDHMSIWLHTADGWEQADTTVQGSYLTFTTDQNPCELAVVSSQVMVWIWIVAGAVLLALIILIAVLVSRHRRRRRNRNRKKQNRQQAEAQAREAAQAREETLQQRAEANARAEAEQARQKKEAEYEELLRMAGDNEIYRVLLQRNRDSDLAVIDRELQLHLMRIAAGDLTPEERAAAQPEASEAAAPAAPAEAAPEAAETPENPENPENAGKPEKPGKQKKQKAPKDRSARKKRRLLVLRIILLIPLLLVGLVIAVLLLHPQWGYAAYSYALLQKLELRDPLAMTLEVSGSAGDADLDFTADICRETTDHQTVTCIDTEGLTLWYANDSVYLDNGSAYTISGLCPDYSDVLEQVLPLYRGADIDGSRDGGYTVFTVDASDDSAEAILRLLSPSVSDQLDAVEKLSISMYTMKRNISYMTFSGAAVLTDGKRIDLDATLQVVSSSTEDHTVPEAVLSAIEAGTPATEITLTSDSLKLLSAWGSFSQEDPQAASINLKAECSVLSLSTDLDWYRRDCSGTEISCITYNGSSIYMSGKSICGPGGTSITTDLQNTASASNLIDLALSLCQSCDTVPADSGDATVYTVTLAGDELLDAATELVPQLSDLNPDLTTGTLTVTVSDGSISDISLSISGNVKAAIVTVPLTVTAQAHLDHAADPAACTIPSNVVSALTA